MSCRPIIINCCDCNEVKKNDCCENGYNVGYGGQGWTPVLAIIEGGERRVQQVVNWVGGTGEKPLVGQYVGSNGFVDDITDAVDIRGKEGATQGLNGKSPYIGENGNWFTWDDETKEYIDTGVKTQGSSTTVEGMLSAGKYQIIKSNVTADTEIPVAILNFPQNIKYNSAGLLTPWAYQKGTEINEFIRRYDNTSDKSFIPNEYIQFSSEGVGVKTSYLEKMTGDEGIFTYRFPEGLESIFSFEVI